jgi:hypothetical protein
MKKVIKLIYDPEEETKEAFEDRKAKAIAGEPEENVMVIVNEIVNWKRPTVDEHGNA